MPDPVLNALRRNLEIAEKAELADKVKRLQDRIGKLEKVPVSKTVPETVAPPVVVSEKTVSEKTFKQEKKN